MARKRAGKTKKSPSSSSQKIPSAPMLEIRPPIEVEKTPPPVATHFWITGNADALIVEFFYLDQEALAKAMLDDNLREDMKRVEGGILIRQTPVARVALPLSVGMDLVSRLFRFTVQGIPGLTNKLTQIGLEMAEAGKAATAVAAAASGQPAAPEGIDDTVAAGAGDDGEA